MLYHLTPHTIQSTLRIVGIVLATIIGLIAILYGILRYLTWAPSAEAVCEHVEELTAQELEASRLDSPIAISPLGTREQCAETLKPNVFDGKIKFAKQMKCINRSNTLEEIPKCLES